MDGGSILAVNDGEYRVPFGDDTAVLTANLFAAKGISRHFGGFQACLGKVAAGDIDAFIAVIRYGLGIKSDAEAARIEDMVFRAGVLHLTAPLTEFVLMLANGGKPLPSAPVQPETAPGKDEA